MKKMYLLTLIIAAIIVHFSLSTDRIIAQTGTGGNTGTGFSITCQTTSSWMTEMLPNGSYYEICATCHSVPTVTSYTYMGECDGISVYRGELIYETYEGYYTRYTCRAPTSLETGTENTVCLATALASGGTVECPERVYNVVPPTGSPMIIYGTGSLPCSM